MLDFGADIDNFYATATYRVFKPVGDGLSAMASIRKRQDDPVEMVRMLASVRYSSTRRRASDMAKQDDVPVQVHVHDFIGKKTGMSSA